MNTPTEVRPKVFADDTGAEWRCVEGELQLRDRDYDNDAPALDDEFKPGHRHFGDAREWIAFLGEQYPDSVPAAISATDNPMTHDEADADDAHLWSRVPQQERSE